MFRKLPARREGFCFHRSKRPRSEFRASNKEPKPTGLRLDKNNTVSSFLENTLFPKGEKAKSSVLSPTRRQARFRNFSFPEPGSIVVNSLFEKEILPRNCAQLKACSKEKIQVCYQPDVKNMFKENIFFFFCKMKSFWSKDKNSIFNN